MLTMAVLVLTWSAAMAQKALQNSKTFDNWYLGLNGEAATKITHNDNYMSNLNPAAGVRLGRYFTPVFGWAVDGSAYFSDKLFGNSKDNPKAFNVALMGTINLSNWLCGYNGRPRKFELTAVAGTGWNCVFDKKVDDKNSMMSKLGLDFAFNLGRKRMWQIYLEPAICYDMNRNQKACFNLDQSALQVALGVVYKFKNSNGTHHFRTGLMRDQHEIDLLNQRINELQVRNEEMDRQMHSDARVIQQLRADLEEARQKK